MELIMTAQITNVDEFLVDKHDSIKDKLQSIVSTAQSMEVTNQDAFLKMTGLYTDSKDWEKRIEFIRKQANQPDQDRINTRNDKAKEVTAPLKQIQSIAKQKCDGYQQLLEKLKQEEEKRIEDASDLLGLDEVPMVMPLDKSVRGDGALMFTRTVRKFRIVDVTKVPLKYLQVNEEMVAMEIKLGVSDIPGIEVYEEKVTQLRTR